MKLFWNLLYFVLYLYPSPVYSDLEYKRTLRSLEIYLDNRLIFVHTLENPAIDIGYGKATYKHDVGNFEVDQDNIKRYSLTDFEVVDEFPVDEPDDQELTETFYVRFFSAKPDLSVSLEFVSNSSINTIRVKELSDTKFNRLWLRLHAEENEHLYGGGEQFSHFSLRGRSYPMWTREQGVGRNKSTLVTYLADVIAGAGGDYHTSYWPQATFVSDRLYFTHLEYGFYSVLNFSSTSFHELELWENVQKAQLHFGTATKWQQLLEKLTLFFGRQPVPPPWLYNGAILGLQGGTEKVLSHYKSLHDQGVKISAIWIQDWSGKIMTSLGKRVYWNWRWNPQMYPDLKNIMKTFKNENKVRFLSYINPHIINGSQMFLEADRNGYFIKSAKSGNTLLVEFGEMLCGSVDLTNPQAYSWYKKVIQDMLDIGFSGWMADFGGEYLPVDDAVYYDGRPASEMHNAYSELWAKLNREAVEEVNMMDDTFIFMRSGFGKSPGYTTISWGGDQNVDFSYADGLASVIPAALSLGMSGMGIHHSDIGGYVSLICMVRTEELILRWAEMSVFTPIMRTHEGNRPYNNFQVYTSNRTAKSFARLTQVYTELTPYHKYVAKENSQYGYPAQRPLFFHYPDDPHVYVVQDQYLYGPDLLVAPVFLEDQRQWSVYLPADEWVYMWNGSVIEVQADKQGKGKIVVLDALLGNPPVFYRRNTKWLQLFQSIAKLAETDTRPEESLSWELLFKEPLIYLYLLLRKIFWYVFFNV